MTKLTLFVQKVLFYGFTLLICFPAPSLITCLCFAWSVCQKCWQYPVWFCLYLQVRRWAEAVSSVFSWARSWDVSAMHTDRVSSRAPKNKCQEHRSCSELLQSLGDGCCLVSQLPEADTAMSPHLYWDVKRLGKFPDVDFQPWKELSAVFRQRDLAVINISGAKRKFSCSTPIQINSDLHTLSVSICSNLVLLMLPTGLFLAFLFPSPGLRKTSLAFHLIDKDSGAAQRFLLINSDLINHEAVRTCFITAAQEGFAPLAASGGEQQSSSHLWVLSFLQVGPPSPPLGSVLCSSTHKHIQHNYVPSPTAIFIRDCRALLKISWDFAVY